MAHSSYPPRGNMSLNLNDLYQFPVQDLAAQLAVKSPVDNASSSNTSLQTQASFPPPFPSVQVGDLKIKKIKTRPEKNITVSVSLVGHHVDFSCVQFSQKHLNRRRLWADDRMRLSKQGGCIVMSVYVAMYSFVSTADGWKTACKRARGEEAIPSRDGRTPITQLDTADPAHPRNGGQILPCERCIDRERKEVSRTKKKKPPDKQMLEYDTERILVINSPEYTDVTTNLDGSKCLTFNMRVTCCCGHQGEKGDGGYVAFFTFKTVGGVLLSQYVSALLQVSSSTDQDNTSGTSKKAMIHPEARRNTDQEVTAGGHEKPKIAFEAQRIYPSGLPTDSESCWRRSSTLKSFRSRPSTLPPTPLTNDFSLPQTPIAPYSVPPTPIGEWFASQDHSMGQFSHAGMDGVTPQFDDNLKSSARDPLYPETMPVFAAPLAGDGIAGDGTSISSLCGPSGTVLPLSQGIQAYADENLSRQGLWGIQSNDDRPTAAAGFFEVHGYDGGRGLANHDAQADDSQATATAELVSTAIPQWPQAFAENKYPQGLQPMHLNNGGTTIPLETLHSDEPQSLSSMGPPEMQTLQTSHQSALESLAEGVRASSIAYGIDSHGRSRSRPSHEQLPRIQTRGLPYPNINLLSQRREKRPSHTHKTPGVQLQSGVSHQPSNGSISHTIDSFGHNPVTSPPIFSGPATPQPNGASMSQAETSQSNGMLWGDAVLTPQGLHTGNNGLQQFPAPNSHSHADSAGTIVPSAAMSPFNGSFTPNGILSPQDSQPMIGIQQATDTDSHPQTIPEGPWLGVDTNETPSQHDAAFSPNFMFSSQGPQITNQWQTYPGHNHTATYWSAT